MARPRTGELPHEQALLEHAGWLRRLALALARDEDLAGDLVQDAWVGCASTRCSRPPW